MKTVCKKLLCLMLVAMMLVSAVPYAFADDAVVEEPVNVPVSVTLDGDVINSSKTLTVNPGESLVLDEAAAMAQIRNQHLGFVFQSFHLLPKMDARDNVALPLLYAGVPLKERRARAEEALKAVGLADRTRFFPNQLSGGQCQRVAIARAIVSKPALLLADEPTGALDSTAGQQIMDIFRQLSREGMTIIMITHEREIAACADKICYIFDGQLSDTDRRRKGGSDHEV